MLGLLALMIGFTFAMSLSRFETRRDAVLNEANAIGTTALRARLLPEPHRTEVLKLLREYVHSPSRRHAALCFPAGTDGCGRSVEPAAGGALAAGQGDRREGHQHGSHRPFHPDAQRDDRQPGKAACCSAQSRAEPVMLALFAVATIAGAFAGYASGLDERRPFAGLPDGPSHRRGHPPDRGPRPAGRGLHRCQPAADDRHGGEYPRLLRLTMSAERALLLQPGRSGDGVPARGVVFDAGRELVRRATERLHALRSHLAEHVI